MITDLPTKRKRYHSDKHFSLFYVPPYKMAAKINWHRNGTKLRHCQPTPPPIGERSIVMSVSVCLSVCVCLSAIISSELHVRSSPHFFFLFTASSSQGCIQITAGEVKPLVETMVKSQV